MFHTVIEAGPTGRSSRRRAPSASRRRAPSCSRSTSTTSTSHALGDPGPGGRGGTTRLQGLAESTPHGIPVTISTDPRHALRRERRRLLRGRGPSRSGRSRSDWPRCATTTPSDASPTSRGRSTSPSASASRCTRRLDLATEPRWARQAGTFGEDPDLVDRAGRGVPRRVPGTRARRGECRLHEPSTSPVAGRRRTARTRTSPTAGSRSTPAVDFAYHLMPFRRRLEAGIAAIMPYYGMPVGLVLDGEPVEPVGFGYNSRSSPALLREQLGFDGVVVTDWELVNDNHVGDQVLPARAWGVEHLDPPAAWSCIIEAGCDQFGGEECVEILLDLVARGRVSEARIDESARTAAARSSSGSGCSTTRTSTRRRRAPRRQGRLPRAGTRRPGAVGDRAHQP